MKQLKKQKVVTQTETLVEADALAKAIAKMPLARKTSDPQLYQQLLEMELRAFEMTGRMPTMESKATEIAEKLRRAKNSE